MEPGRGPQYRSLLLPWEQQFCDTINISSEEYFAYYDLVAQRLKEEKGRELIPDVRNEPVTIVTLVVGIALSAVGMLLAPKPRAPEQRKQGDPFQAQDIRGRTKFAPLTQFDSVQDLATLGSLVPLIYTRRYGGHGGVRVESQMLWSRMRNSATYQELRALMLFSAGKLDEDPKYEGFAFGQSKLSSYSAQKISLWFNRGRARDDRNAPFANGDGMQYSEGKRQTGSDGIKPFFYDMPDDGKPVRMMFCGTLTPSQSVKFGQYSPIRNGQGWKYPFQWPGKGDGDGDKKDIILGTRRKHTCGYHAGRTEMRRESGGKYYVYKIHDSDSDKIFQACRDDASNPKRKVKDHFDSSGKLRVESVVNERDSLAEKVGGLSEGIQAIKQSQSEADDALDIGEMYLIGTDIYTCTERDVDRGGEGQPFEPGVSGDVKYTFERNDEYEVDMVDDKYIRVDDDQDVHNEKHCPIQKVAIGAIGTTRMVDYVEIGFKSTVYRQVNGFPNVSQFTSNDLPDDFAKDGQGFQMGTMNTYYDRVSLFRMEIRKDNEDWYEWSREELFAVHGRSAQPQYNQILIKLPTKDFYEFRFIPVCGNAWISNNNYEDKDVYLLNARRSYERVSSRGGFECWIRGKTVRLREEYLMSNFIFATGERDLPNTNPNNLLQDFWYYDSDTSSHANEPEHSITWLNEYVENSDEWYKHENKQYEHLAHAGLICRSSKEVSTFSNFSAYFVEGIRVKKFVAGNVEPERCTNLFPEVAYDLLTNRRYGVGEFVGKASVSDHRFGVAAFFCNANEFYWDGVISGKTNVRNFLFEQAAFQLLDFTILGGQFSLYPAVPFKSDFTIDFDASPGDSSFPIKALLTNGNVRNFRTTFLSPEERQLFTAEIKWRFEKRDDFPETRITRVRLADSEGGYFRDPVEVFDCTQFMTTRDHAINFAKYALRTRQTVDHSVSFETTPDAAHSLMPGDYIRVAVSIQHQERNRGYDERLRTGSVTPGGIVQVNQGVNMQSDNVDVFYWKPGMTAVREGRMQVSNNKATDTSFHGSLFTVKRNKSEARIYKIESIAYTDESFVEISASYTPLTGNKKMKLLEWDDSDFVVEDAES